MGALEAPGPGTGRSPSRDALISGTRLGDFEIVRTLGGGGFGTVYLARDCLLDREVAIKEYMPSQLAYRAGMEVVIRGAEHAASFEAGLRSFVNEAKILAHFNHPGIVKVHRFWEANGTAYMVMPYVHGPTLRDVRRSMKTPPTEAWFRSVLDPLLDALSMLHAEGIYHRDIAPDNILLPRAGEPVLLDFGAARRVIGDCTQTFTAVLKPSYAPIEQYAEAVQLKQGPWTDLYALGAVIVYMLRAAPPPPATVRSLHDELPALLDEPPPGVSTNFVASVHWTLAVRPQDRPQSVQQFRNALDGRVIPPPVPRMPQVPSDLADAADASAISPQAALLQSNEASESAAHFTLHTDVPSFERPDASTWDTTNRLRTGATTDGASAAGRLRWDVPDLRGAAVLGGVALVLAGAAMLTWWKHRVPEPGVAVWRELGRQQAVETRRPAAGAPVPVPAAAQSPARAMHLAAVQSVPSAAPRETPPLRAVVSVPDKRAPPMIDRLADEDLFERSAMTKPSDKAKPAVKKKVSPARPKATPGPRVAAMGPKEACGDRNFISMAFCVNRKCEDPAFRQHPQCVELFRQYEERRRAVPYR